MFMLHVHTACQCCKPLLHVLAVSPRRISELNVQAASMPLLHATCPCKIYILYVHVHVRATFTYMSILYAACPCYISLLDLCAASPCQ
jgi:hypothetical protein